MRGKTRRNTNENIIFQYVKSPQGKSTFFRALSQILCAFCQGQLRNFALFLVTEKQSLRNCAFGTNKLRSKRETLCTLFSHTFFFAKRPHTQRPRSQPHFSIRPHLMYKHLLREDTIDTHQHRRRPTNSPSSISQSRRGSYEIQIIEKCKATFDFAIGRSLLI